MRLISVIIGAKTGKDRFKESTELLNYGFANYQNKQIVNKNNIICEIKTTRCKQKTTKVYALEDYYAFDKKGDKSNYNIPYNLPDSIGKTKAGNKIGEAIITKDGNVIKIIPLIINENLDSMSYFDNFKSIIKSW